MTSQKQSKIGAIRSIRVVAPSPGPDLDKPPC